MLGTCWKPPPWKSHRASENKPLEDVKFARICTTDSQIQGIRAILFVDYLAGGGWRAVLWDPCFNLNPNEGPPSYLLLPRLPHCRQPPTQAFLSLHSISLRQRHFKSLNPRANFDFTQRWRLFQYSCPSDSYLEEEKKEKKQW